MLYIATSLYCEAKPFIIHFQLKKTDRFHKFQVFLGDNIILIITGQGDIASAASIACVCTAFTPREGDFFLSYGSCAAMSEEMPVGEVYLLNKIIRAEMKQSFYPDVLFRHPFREITGITGGRILYRDSYDRIYLPCDIKEKCITYDMEAAASYLSASYFFGTHQMVFLRIVSDYGISREAKKKLIKSDTAASIIAMTENRMDILIPFTEKFINWKREEEHPFYMEAEEFLTRMEHSLHLSVSMMNTLRQHVRFYLLMHENLAPVIDWCSTHIPALCESKREGKVYFEELKRQLL